MSFGYGTGASVQGKVARAAAGIPIEEGDTFFLFVRNRMATPIPVVLVATLYNPRTDASVSFAHSFTPTGTTYAQETSQSPNLPAGTLLTSVVIITQGAATKSALWAAAELFRGGQTIAFLCADELNASNVPSWPRGSDGQPLANITRQGALFTFQGTVANGAGGGGNQSLTITAATGGRFRLLFARVVNNDTVARVASGEVFDASGGNLLHSIGFNTALAAGAAINFPSVSATDAATTAANPMGVSPYWIAGANVMVFTVAAVAASQDSAYAVVLEVWGGAPTMTLAGASTPTLTTNTSRFEEG